LLVAADNEMMMDDDDDDDDVMMWATESNMPTTEKNRITAVANIAADITKQFFRYGHSYRYQTLHERLKVAATANSPTDLPAPTLPGRLLLLSLPWPRPVSLE
jgi:hypothetical protein